MFIKVLAFLTIIGIATYIEISKMNKQKMKKEIIIYSVFLAISSVFFILKLMEVSIPNPLDGIRFIFEPIGKGIEGLFLKGGST